MKDYDERAWELEVARCDDGDILLSQGYCPCGCGDEVLIRLNPAHFALVGRHLDLIPTSEVERRTERERDKLGLLAAMVMAHTRPEDPLRAAVACLVGDRPIKLIAASNQNDCRTLPEPLEDPYETLGSPSRPESGLVPNRDASHIGTSPHRSRPENGISPKNGTVPKTGPLQPAAAATDGNQISLLEENQ